MARSLDIETLIEDAFISNLATYVDTSVTVKRWEDIKEKDLTPSVKVSATISDDQEGTINLYCATNMLVDFGIFTSRKSDENGKTANGIRGDVRNLLNQDDIVNLLNSTEGLAVYNNGVIPQDSGNVPDDKIWQKTITVLVVATTEEVT